MVAKVRIGWLVDDNQYHGGAELAADNLASIAPGHVEIVPCPPDRVAQDVDAYVVHNCVWYPKQTIDRLEQHPVFKMVHDMWTHGNADLRNWLLTNAELVFFSSPLHRERFRFPVSTETVVIPQYVPSGMFKMVTLTKREGDNPAIWAGRIWHGKGIANAILWARTRNVAIDFYGFGQGLEEIVPPGRYCGAYHHNQFPAILSGYRTFVHLPENVEPFGRAVVEAWFAGLDLVINANVGAGYWIKHDPDRLETAGQDFWNCVLERI